jgi:hypothetical protein
MFALFLVFLLNLFGLRGCQNFCDQTHRTNPINWILSFNDRVPSDSGFRLKYDESSHWKQIAKPKKFSQTFINELMNRKIYI